MSKNYRQSGVAANVELSQGGSRVKNNAGIIEHRNNADDAFVVVRGASPQAGNDFVTKDFLLNQGLPVVVGNIYDSGSTTPASTQFTGAGQEGFLAICNETVVGTQTFTINNIYRLDLWDTDVESSTWTTIAPTENMRMSNSVASSGGSPAYLADKLYLWDPTGASWIDVGPAAAITAVNKNFVAALVFGTSSPLAIGTPPAGCYVSRITVIVDTPFDGTAPLLDIGTAATTDLYMDQLEINLKVAETYYVDEPILDAAGTAIIGTYVADSSTAGAATVIVKYDIA